MPTVRLFAQTSAGRAALLVAIVVLAIAFAPLPTTRNASACPIVMPVPLRALYTNSDLVVVARFGETTPVEMLAASENSTYKTYLMKTDLRVSSTVKGSRDFSIVHFYHWGFTMDGGKYQHSYDEYADGDKLLAFLIPREGGGEGYQATDKNYGVKKLSDADLKVYLQRIDELAIILQHEKPDQAQIVEWLVRCAEEPVTRWDGLYELSSGYTPLDSDEKEAPAETEETESAETNQKRDATNDDTAAAENADENSQEVAAEPAPEQATVPTISVRGLYLYRPDPDLARLLTVEQKTRLSNILFNMKVVTDNEMLLIDLVRQWDSTRVVQFVMSQLRGFADDPPYVAQSLVSFMSEKFEDEELNKLAEKYIEEAEYADTEADASSEDNAEGEAESAEAAAEETEKDSDEKEAPEEAVFGSNTEKRSIRLKRFIAHLESVLARRGWQGNELVTPAERAVARSSGQPK